MAPFLSATAVCIIENFLAPTIRRKSELESLWYRMKTTWKTICGALMCSSLLMTTDAFSQAYEEDIVRRPGVEMNEPAGADTNGMGWSWLGLLGLLGLFGLRGASRHEREYHHSPNPA